MLIFRPTFSSIKWGKNGQDYLTLPGKSSTTEIRELERVTSKLRIGDATSTDAGRYSCQASNAFGTSHFSIDVTIWGKLFAYAQKPHPAAFAAANLLDNTDKILSLFQNRLRRPRI